MLTVTTKKSSCPSVFFPAFLQTAVIDKPVTALFENASIGSTYYGGLKPALHKALQYEAYSGVLQKRWNRKFKNARIGLLISLMGKTYCSAFRSAGIANAFKSAGISPTP